MRTMKLAVFASALALVALAGCQCGEDPTSTNDAGTRRDAGGGGGDDAGGGGGDGGGIHDGGVCTLKANGEACTADGECCSNACDPNTNMCVSGGGACFGVGETCQANVECCGGNTCAEDGTGVKRCIDESFCKAPGAACTQASQCCSLSCDGTCQTTGNLCTVAGGSCGANTDCCSNICTGGTCVAAGQGCSTLGESCTMGSNCCSLNCQDFGSDGGQDLRCAPASSCGARGEICAQNSDCCSGVCLNGLCPTQAQLGQKRFVGEPCVQDSDCASYACASSYQGGPKTCQFLGGCRPAEEICTDDYQCCGYLELSNNRDMCQTAQPTPGTCAQVSGIPDLRRCTLQPTDKEVGEICESNGVTVHNCCGGADACKPTITGVSRCFYGGGFTADGGCTANGESCSIADQCCSKICAPGALSDGGTGLLCSGCINAGGACTTDNDCCGKSCVDGLCQMPTTDAGSVCTPLGGACTDSAQCCSLLCSTGDGGTNTCVSQIN